MLQTRGNRLTWLGHAAFRIDTPSGKVILVDPWIQTNPMCPEANKKFERVDAMLITHGHFDHIADAVDLGKKFKPQIVGIYELCAWLESKGVPNTSAMNKGGTQTAGEIEVTMVNAVHSCGIKDGDEIIYGGEACGYIIRLPGGLTVYHAGDTALFGDMKLIGELYAPDVALLPIGDHYTMGPREAAMAIRFLNVRHVIPMHFGTFPALTGRPEQVRQLTEDISGLEIHTLKPGESIGELSSHVGLRA
ncbi:MAG: metal-dependent hydrolase [Candidatus Acidiferrales bacterium]